jgi:predicted aspartyl protease
LFNAKTACIPAFLLLIAAPLLYGPAIADTLVPIKRHQELDTYYISVGVAGGTPEDYLLDTGAGYMTITDSTLDRLRAAGAATYLRELDGHTADGSVLRVSVYRLEEIRVAQSCRLQNVEVAVLPGASRGLFGLSALRKVSPFELSFDPPTLRLANCVEEPVGPLATD